jgi:hypothetical protein
MSQSNWRFRTSGGALDEGSGGPGVVGELLASWQVGGERAGWRPFLHHVSKSEPKQRG